MKILKKPFAILLSVLILISQINPTGLMALTSGPAQAEFTSFEPVTTENMVNEFTGAFTYNLPVISIPGPHGISYPLSLSYHNGRQPDEEASWVGLGWSFSPGAAVRNKRGFPDDYNGAEVLYYNKQRTVKTFTLMGSVAAELFSADPGDEGISIPLVNAGASAAIHFNNYQGVGYSIGLTAGLLGMASLDYTKSETEHSFSGKINPAGLLTHVAGEFIKDNVPDFKSDLAQNAYGPSMKFAVGKLMPYGINSAYSAMGGKFSYYSNSSEVRPTNTVGYSGTSTTLKVSVGGAPSGIPVEGNVGLTAVCGRQTNTPVESLLAYGYMYSANAREDDMMDVGIERNNGYNKNDYYLPIPINNYDMWSFTGEGSMGGARMYHKTVGHFRPNKKSSSTAIISLGGEITLGADAGPGSSITFGDQSLTVTDWNEEGSLNEYSFSEAEGGHNEPVFFKFDGDLGGATDYYSNDNPTQASTNEYSDGEYKAVMPSDIYTVNRNDRDSRTGRSAYIAYHTMDEINQKSTSGSSYFDNYYSYTKNAKTLKMATYSERSDDLGEMAVTQANGMQYVYGIPVYARHEGTFRYGLLKEDGKTSVVSDSKPGLVSMNASFLNSSGGEPDLLNFNGEYASQPYVSTYLLSQITSTDFIDKTMNGPSDDDFGGWVKFDYTQVFGSEDKDDNTKDWYNWRIPYNGVSYQANSLSDEYDDEGIVSFGEKEVYYVKAIETQTHKAVFITSDREDGREAVELGVPSSSASWPSDDDAATGFSKQGGSTTGPHLQKLDRVELYAKTISTMGIVTYKLIKTVHFEYDYSLCQGIPDNESKSFVDEGTGKLTLKKLWIEDYPASYTTGSASGNKGIQKRISPYEFSYEYKTSYPTEITDRYEVPSTAYNQNPDYEDSRYADSWGNYQLNGDERINVQQNWLNQSASEFDPGAWELKVIKLPSKGEILVEYEQQEYSYVQNKKAMALVNLYDGDGDNEYTVDDIDPTYWIDLSQLGVDVSDENNVIEWVAYLKKYFSNKKIFFNYLYTLRDGESPGFNSSSEYISGYAAVKEVSHSGSYISIQLDASDEEKYLSPNQVCKEFKKTNKIGSGAVIDFLDNQAEDPESAVYVMLELLTSFDGEEDEGCKTISTPYSYFKIPMLTSKKGGGNRVKALLMCDEGISSGKAKLYGKRYSYITTDEDTGEEISSGVITMEPSGSRGENPLVYILDRAEQTSWDRLVAGRDKRQMEGPLGESLMPSPMVGYSTVTVSDIHEGATSPGFVINDFYTMKDEFFGHNAVERNETEIDMENYQKQTNGLFSPTYIDNFILTQGYSFNYYSINGKPKQIRMCGGSVDNYTVSKDVTYEYYEPGDDILWFDGKDIIETEYPKDEDVVLYSNKVIDNTEIHTLEFDATLGFWGVVVIPYVLAIPFSLKQESGLFQHIICKNNQYPVLLKTVATTENGIVFTDSYSVFDQYTGSPSVSKTSGLGFNGDNSDGYYRNYTLFAPYQYEEIGQKSANERAYLEYDASSLTIEKAYSSGTTTLTFESPDGSIDLCSLRGLLYPGDLIQLGKAGMGLDEDFYNVNSWDGNVLNLYSSSQYGSINGTYDVDVEVIKSGRTNQLNASLGKITTYGSEWELTEEFNPDAERQRLVEELNSKLSSSLIFDLDLVNDYPDLIISETITGTECMTVNDYYKSTFSNLKFYVNFANVATAFSKIGGINECSQNYHIADLTYYDSVGYFKLDENTGDIVFVSLDMECDYQLVVCLESCKKTSTYFHLEDVIDASVSTIDDEWGYDKTVFGGGWLSGSTNDYELGEKGKWRSQSSFVYNTPISGLESSASSNNNFELGLYDDFVLFNQQYLPANNSTDWLKLNVIKEYAPNGGAILDSNLIGAYSTIKYGYHNLLPLVAGNNAQNEEVFYDGFENTYIVSGTSYLEDGFPLFASSIGRINSSNSHTGVSSLRLSIGAMSVVRKMALKSMLVTDNIKENGLSFRFWVKQISTTGAPSLEWDLTTMFNATVSVGGIIVSSGTFSSLSKTGEWELLECVFDASDLTRPRFASGNYFVPTITFTRPSILEKNVYVDDIRIQPISSQMNCYVYDNTFKRTSALLDDQHFATIYQYDDEGRLVSLKKETEQGIKTIKEKQFHIPSEVK